MYHNRNIDDILKELDTTIDGLTTIEVDKRKAEYGLNTLPSKKNKSLLLFFWEELKEPIVILLMVTVLVSLLVGEFIDALAILFIILIDVCMGTWQEYKANNTALQLSKLVSLKSKVKRNGKIIKIDSSELTLGDIVILESGDKINADLRIIDAQNLLVDESILTGESVNITKNKDIILEENISIAEQSNMLFAGTNVVRGRALAVVVKIGMKTEIGKIQETLNKTEDELSPLTIRITKFSKQISFLLIIVAIILTVLLIVKNVPYKEIFLSVIALSVSAMPEGLPLALTMALTIASNKMAKKNVIVRKLNSVESLGSVTVIASDKTGTLTVNEQMARIILFPNNESCNITGVGYNLEGSIQGNNLEEAKKIGFLGLINNEANFVNKKYVGDSIDIAFLVLAQKLQIDNNAKIIYRIPYESENKYSAVFYEWNDKIYCTVKGSLEVIKNFCTKINLTNAKINSDYLDNQNEKLAQDGYRVIAIANGEVEKKKTYTEEDIKKLVFMGMVGFIDPIRKDVITAIESCHEAGIKVLMITGDHPLTSLSIAKELGLAKSYEDVTTGKELEEYIKKGEKEFNKFIKNKKIFARVTPIQKLNIINALKENEEFVAVTGDGVNDAPALKSANIGIAMGSGTDIARDASDMIIMDDNFKSIVSGIYEGRCAYANIRKIIYFLISCGLAEVLFFTLSILFDLPMPLVAIQLLWLNVVTDGIQDFALSFEKGDNKIMQEKPINPKEPLFDKRLFREIIASGLFIGLVIFIIWIYLLHFLQMALSLARGYIMALMVFIQNIHAFNCRSEKESVLNIPIKRNPLIFYGVAASILLQIIVMEIPLLAQFLQTSSIPFSHLLILFIISLAILLFGEIYKKITYKE